MMTLGGLTDVMTVNVVRLTDEPVLPESISYDIDTLKLVKPNSGTATQDVGYTINPSYVDDSSVSVTSYNEDVVTAAIVGGKVLLTVVGVGTANVVIKTGANSLTDVLPVTVVPENEYVPSTSAAFDVSSLEMTLGGIMPPTSEVAYHIYPIDTDDEVASVISSNDGIVRVTDWDDGDQTVDLLALRTGTATITLTTQEGKQATLTVTVTKAAPESIKFLSDGVNITIPVGRDRSCQQGAVCRDARRDRVLFFRYVYLVRRRHRDGFCESVRSQCAGDHRQERRLCDDHRHHL